MADESGLRDRQWNDRGATIVEFALLAPVVMAVLIGMITAGLALSTKNSMTNAVREAARVGATLPKGTSWDDWAASVKDRADELAGSDLDASDVCVEMVSVSAGPDTIEGRHPAGACPLSSSAPPTPSTAPDGSCVVKVWAERHATLNALFFSRQLTLEARAVGRYERIECP